MKHLYTFLLICSGFSIFAQNIGNVRYDVEDNKIVILYDIVNAKPNQDFYVTAFCSMDGGATYGKVLNSVNGDIGFSVKPGTGKKIVWDVLNDMESLKGDRVAFKIKALVKEKTESNNQSSSNNNMANSAGNASAKDSKFIKPDDMKKFKDDALQKTTALSQYIVTITDKSLENDTKMLAVEQAVRLFQSEESTVESSSKEKSDVKTMPIRSYLNKIRVLKYSKIVITWYDINYVSDFKLGANGKYYAVITVWQKFQGFQDNKIVYEDETQKQMEVVLDSVDKKIGDQVIKQYEVLLGNISVVETR